jgi:hypothetical protein
MPTLLDGVLERHEGPEPRVLTEDVQAVLRRRVQPGDDSSGESVTLIADNAEVSARTVYRVLGADKPELSLDLADKLCLAAGTHPALAGVRLVWPDGTITDYRFLPMSDDGGE